jgi:hypothetical protein
VISLLEYKINNTNSFKISGDMGDIIYSLLYAKILKTKKIFIDSSGGKDYIRDGFIRNVKTKFNLKSAEFLMPLLEKQSYVKVEIYNSQPYDFDMSEFDYRDITIRDLNIFHSKKFPNFDLNLLNQKWLECNTNIIDPVPERQLIISRSLRYLGNDNYYYLNLDRISKNGIFVGIEEEYKRFVELYNCKIPFFKGKNCLDVANFISKKTNFLGNGSLVCSIAIGLGLKIEYEYCIHASHYKFNDIVYF